MPRATIPTAAMGASQRPEFASARCGSDWARADARTAKNAATRTRVHSSHAGHIVAAGGATKTYSTPLGFWSGTNVPSTPAQKNRHETQAARSHHMSALSFDGWKR